MKRMLVTGGTVFVSRFIAEYFLSAGNSREQSAGVKPIRADRHALGDVLRRFAFD